MLIQETLRAGDQLLKCLVKANQITICNEKTFFYEKVKILNNKHVISTIRENSNLSFQRHQLRLSTIDSRICGKEKEK